MSEALLDVEGVSKMFKVRGGGVGSRGALLRAVNQVTFDINQNETVALVGESGCGKSTTASMILQLARPSAGVIRFNGTDINKARGRDWTTYRQSVQAVLQDPFNSLNPRMRVRRIIAEPLVVSSQLTRRQIAQRVAELLADVGLPADAADLYPHEFSGGQRQRIALARSLALRPKLIVLDEAVSGLDVSIKAQILNLLKDLQSEYHIAYLVISHNLADVQYLCDRVMVMYLGRIVESGPVGQVFGEPLHPYTKALLSAALPLEPQQGERDEEAVIGEVPSPIHPPTGCTFHTRCPEVMDICRTQVPVLETIRVGRTAACHLHGVTASSAGSQASQQE